MNFYEIKDLDLKEENRKIRRTKMIFYLKVNRDEGYTFRNLQHWVNIVESIPYSRYYILCDKESLKQSIEEKVIFKTQEVEFLQSYRDLPELKYIADNITEEMWRKAGYAHLTTFWHAKENNYPFFWNIDADDTCICLFPDRVRELLAEVETFVKENKVDIISLDMWNTRTNGFHWSFGVTYVNNSNDWNGVMKEHCLDEAMKATQIRNVDGYFSCLRICSKLKIATFYFENLKFIHYADDFFKRPDTSGFFHWKNGELILPILRDCFGINSIGTVPIVKDIVPFDINITDEETTEFLMEYAQGHEKQLLKSRMWGAGEIK